MWHSLDENGKIEIYDVEWPDGTVETNIPVGLLESVREGSHTEGEKHGVQEKDTPVNERNYKGKMMKITKRQLRKIIKEEKAKILEEGLPGGYRHPKTGEDLFLMLNDAIDKLLDQGMDTGELADELRGLADDVLDSAPMNAEDQFVDAGIRAREMSKRR